MATTNSACEMAQDPRITTQQAVQLLLSTANLGQDISKDDESAAQTIVTALKSHVLAVAVAGSFISAHSYRLEDYASCLAEVGPRLVSQSQRADPECIMLYAACELSIASLESSEEANDKYAVELLNILAFLDSEDISEDVFLRGWKRVANYHDNTEELNTDPPGERWSLRYLSSWHVQTAMGYDWANAFDISAFHHARSRLAQLSLVFWDADTAAISVHPLVHFWARFRLSHEQRSRAWASAIATLSLSTEGDCGWSDFIPRLRRHIEVCFDRQPSQTSLLKTHAASICQSYYIFWWMLYRARSVRIGDIMQRLQELVKFSQTDNDASPSSNTLLLWRMESITLEESGSHEQSILIVRKCIAVHKEITGPGSFNVIRAQVALAQALTHVGEHQEACDLLREVLEMMKDGAKDHINRLLALHVLGMTHIHMGNADKALPLLEEAVSIREQEIASEDRYQHLLGHRTVLATAYRQTGNTKKAVAIMEVINEIEERRLDPESHARLGTLFSLAMAYLDDVQPKKAIQILQHVVGVRIRLLPSHNSNLLASQHGLARAYLHNDEPQLAVPLLETVVDIESRTLPDGNQNRYLSIKLLIHALICNRQGSEARDVLKKLQLHTDSNVPGEDLRKDIETFEERLSELEK